MAYSVRVDRIGASGVPSGKAALYEVDSQIEAITVATYEVDAHRSTGRRIATVFGPSGSLVFAYTGGARDRADARRQ